MAFKVIAIRPLKGCAKEFSRVLKVGKIYLFDHSFTFKEDDQGNVTSIAFTNTGTDGLYDIYIGPERKRIPVKITAIVGKNGSGKSTLIELLFSTIYNFSLYKKILTTDENGNSLKFQKTFATEIYFQIDLTIYCLKVLTDPKGESAQVELVLFNEDQSNNFYPTNFKKPTDEYGFLFYTIAINYSLYGLNSEHLGDWIKTLFHKNDGYQTPVVINPYRKKGNIDINIENDLVKQRLLANLLEPVTEKHNLEGTLRTLAPGKTAVTLRLQINKEKIELYKNNKELGDVKNVEECLWSLYFEYTGIWIQHAPFEPEFYYADLYIKYKLIRICTHYDRFKIYLIDGSFLVDELVKNVIMDKSHITFKLKQALNFMRYLHIPGVKASEPFDVEISVLSEKIQDIRKDTKKALTIMELLPPSFFTVDILFNITESLEDCSSGEKQKIHSLNSLVYHMINVNSVFYSSERYSSKEGNAILKYRYVNICFDEVELYFHPEYQRTFINDVLEIFKKINPDMLWNFEGINIIFSTHSPFILSDIPHSNILFLHEDGSNRGIQNMKTFGANIHDLLKHSFFFNGAPIGQYAKQQIGMAIDFLNIKKAEQDFIKKKNSSLMNEVIEGMDEKKRKLSESSFDDIKCRQIIQLIDEPILKMKLIQLYDEIFQAGDELKLVQKRIADLQEIEQQLKLNR